MKDKSIQDHLNKYIGISALVHIVILAFSSGITMCSSNEIILPPSVQVDIIAPSDLPTKVNKAPEPIAKPVVEKAPPKELPKKEVEPPPESEGPKVNLEAEKKKKKEKKKKELKKKKLAEEKKKELEREKKEKKKKDLQKKNKSKQEEALNRLKQKAAMDKLTKKPTVNAGKRLNPGTSFDGLDSIQFQKYYGDIKGHLYNNWSIPQWLSELDLKAQALVVLDGNGYVLKKQILKSSGNPNFDNTVLAAIDRASPFPMAPDRLKDKVKNKEIVFGFPEN